MGRAETMGPGVRCCSSCGQPLARRTWPDPDMIKMPRRERQVFRALIAANGHFVSVRRLVDHLSGDEDDGGPLAAEASLHGFVHKLRLKLEPLGLFIETARFEGYRIGQHDHLVINGNQHGKGELAWPAR